MQLGIGLPSFASDTHALPPDRFRRYAELADEYDFSGAWLIEHLLEPSTYATSLLDPLTTLAYTAGATNTIPVGTSVLLLPLRDPVMVAKRAATIQHLSSRRLTLGLGTGYIADEFDAVGVPMAERSARYLEGIELLWRLFHEDTVTFDGEFYSLQDFRLEPSLDHPPRILAGGGGVDTDDGRRVASSVTARLDHAHGWIAPPRPIDVIEHDWNAFAAHLESQGRDPDAVDKVALQYLHLEPGDSPEQVRRAQRNAYDQLVGADRSPEYAMDHWLSGTVDQVRETLAEYERLGFDQVILHPTVREPNELDRQLRLYRDLLRSEYP